MKKNYINKLAGLLLIMVGFTLISFSARAQVTITQWTFEGDVITPSTGSGTASLIGGTTSTFATGVSGSPDRAWNTSGYPEQGVGSGTAGVEYEVSTVSYSNISVEWDHRHSNTSANRIRLQYTLNGTDWINFEASSANATNMAADVDKGFDNGRYVADAGDTWYHRTASFASVSGASNNPSFAIRIVSEFADGTEYAAATSTSTYSPNGTLRYDNVTFAGAGNSPLLTATPSSLSGFTYVEGNGPSDMQTTILNAFNLEPASGTVTITPPANFEYSVDGVNFFTSPGNVAYENGSFPGNGDVPVRLRLIAGLAAGSYSGDLIVTGGGAPELMVGLSGSVTLETPAGISSIILPQFIQGAVPNTNRVPFAYFATLSNLLPSSTYRFYNKIVLSTDAPDYNGAGNCIFVDPTTGTFTRTSSTSMTAAGQYGEFTTDASGNYSGWFITEPTGNSTRFKPGTDLYARIMLNDGAGGTVETTRLTSADSFRVLGFYATSADSTGTAIRGISNYGAKNFVLLYNNESGTGRPLYATQVEACGVDFTGTNSYAAFYTENVEGNEGMWGGIVPNINAAGVMRIEERSLTSGSIVASNTSANGVWNATDTRNPSGGTDDVLVINTTLGVNLPAAAFGKIYATGSTLKLELNQKIAGTVQVLGITGQVMADFSINGNTASYSTNLPEGVYIVRVLSNKGINTSKVFIR